MRHLTSIFIAGLSFMTTPVFASDWLLVSEKPSGGRVWIDLESISKVDQKVTLWMKISFGNPESDGAATMVSYLTVDCNASTYDLKHYVRSDADGAVIANNPVYFRRWDPIPPDSHIAFAYKSSCAS